MLDRCTVLMFPLAVFTAIASALTIWITFPENSLSFSLIPESLGVQSFQIRTNRSLAPLEVEKLKNQNEKLFYSYAIWSVRLCDLDEVMNVLFQSSQLRWTLRVWRNAPINASSKSFLQQKFSDVAVLNKIFYVSVGVKWSLYNTWKDCTVNLPKWSASLFSLTCPCPGPRLSALTFMLYQSFLAQILNWVVYTKEFTTVEERLCHQQWGKLPVSISKQCLILGIMPFCEINTPRWIQCVKQSSLPGSPCFRVSVYKLWPQSVQ